MYIQQIVSFVFIYICSVAIALPHTGMVDTAYIRDIGVVYSKRNFEGESKFLFEYKAHTGCQALLTRFGGMDVVSVAICKTDVECTFYTGSDCDANTDSYAVGVGCGDASLVETPKGNEFRSYRCGKIGTLGPVNYNVQTTPHDAT